MPYPFAQMPTLRQFIDEAKKHGCTEGYSKSELVGPRGSARVHYLIGPNGVVYPLPDIKDDDRLTPTIMASIARALQISILHELYSHLH